MTYMINIDLEVLNEFNGDPACASALHVAYGKHYDLTVHALGCSTRNSRSVSNRTKRYWDDNNGSGYSLEAVIQRVRELQLQERNAFARRCGRCGVSQHLPDWD